jgi:hypothetical protein
MIYKKTLKWNELQLKWHLKECGFEFEKVEVEYAVYDTNTTHDLAWIKPS